MLNRLENIALRIISIQIHSVSNKQVIKTIDDQSSTNDDDNIKEFKVNKMADDVKEYIDV